jgi:DNA excision repair protein ERCC-2
VSSPREFFPFPRIRRGQDAFLADARRTVAEGKHLLAHAPTGIGKTAVGLAAALEYAMGHNKIVFFLTSKQSQHRIAIDTLRRMRARGVPVAVVDVIAKQAMCLQDAAPAFGKAFHEFCDLKVKARKCGFFNRAADPVVRTVQERVLHVQELVRVSAAVGTCPHKAALEAAKKAHVVVCDYNYVFSPIQERIFQRLNRPLDDAILVVDEAHNLPDRIRGHLCGDLTLTDLAKAEREARDLHPELAFHLGRLVRILVRLFGSVQGERRIDRAFLVHRVEKVLRGGLGKRPRYADFVGLLERAGEEAVRRGRNTVLLDVAEFFRRWAGDDEGVVHIMEGGAARRLRYRLLDPSVLSRAVFDRAHASILMSGTLHPGGMYADLLGIPPDRRLVRSYPSPFPPENRMILLTPRLTTLYERRDPPMFRRIAEEIARLAAATPGNVAAFFPSYALLRKIGKVLAASSHGKRLLVERQDWSKAQRDAAVEMLRVLEGRGGALLLGVQGGSFSEGVDYANNLLRAIVIVGLPLGPPTVEVEALKTYYMAKFGRERGLDYAYVYPALNKVLQSAGRAIRSETDRAVIVLMDGRLAEPRYRRRLPRDFVFRVSRSVADEARTFFYAPAMAVVHADQAGRRGRTAAR